MNANAESKHVIYHPTEKVMMVTPEMALLWVDNYNYHHQRPIRSWHVNALARMMEDGRFRQKTQINFCRYKGGYYLTNGQHTLMGIVKSGIPQLLSVIVSDMASLEEIADDYARHDTHLTRKHSDSLVAHEVGDKLGITKSQLQWVSAACMYYAFGIDEIAEKSPARLTHDEKMDIVMRHGELGKHALDMVPTAYAKGQSWAVRKTTLAAIMLTLEHCPDIAEEFWPLAITDDGLSIGDPRKAINKYLCSVVTGGNNDVASTKKRAGNIDIMKRIALCWNAFVTRSEVRVMRVDHEGRIAVFKKCGEFRCG